MKDLFKLFIILLTCAWGLTCCSDDEEAAPELKVVKSDVSYDAKGGEGVIELLSTMPVTATSSEDWCTVIVEGNRVKLSVRENLEESSRSAMIGISTVALNTKVAIYQMGSIFDTDMEDLWIGGKGGEFTFYVKSSHEVVIATKEPVGWLTFRQEGENVVVKVDALVPPGERECTVTLAAGPTEREYTFSQTCMSGEFTCFYNNWYDLPKQCTLTLEQNADDPSIYKVMPEGSPFDAPYNITYKNHLFILKFNQVLGQTSYENSMRNVVLCAYDKAGRLSWNTNIEYVAPVAFDDTGAMQQLVFGDNGTWAGQHVDGLYFSVAGEDGTPTGTGVDRMTDLVWVRK